MKHQGWIMGICAVILLGAAALCFRLNMPQTVVSVETYQPERELKDMTEAASAGSEPEEAPKSRQKTDADEASDGKPAQETDGVEADEVPAETPAREPVYDLNAAEKEDLMRIEGIGEALADAIIAYRTEIGGFTRRAELTEIRGIGESLSARIMAEFFIPDELPPDIPPEAAPAVQTETEMPERDGDMPKAEPTPKPEPAAEPEPTELYFELNTVTYEQLMLLPDMKPEWAAGIVDVREKLGGYYSMEELNLVEGLPGEYAEYVLREYLYLDKPEG